MSDGETAKIAVENLAAAYGKARVLDGVSVSVGDDDAEEYLIITRWESREAQRAWTRGDAFRRGARADPRADFIIGPARFRGCDIRLSSEPAE